MIVTLKNIGTIKEASFDLDKDLIVFIGPNNTGKTYAAYCLYGLDKFNPSLSTEIIDSVINLNLNLLFKTGSIEIDLEEIFTIENVNKIFSEYNSIFKDYLPKLFAFNKEYFDKSEVLFSYESTTELKKYLQQFDFLLSSSESENFVINFSKKQNSKILNVKINSYTHAGEQSYIETDHHIKQEIIKYTLEPLTATWGVHFIPAERIGMSVFSKDIFSRRFAKTNEILANEYLNERQAFNLMKNEFNAYSLIIQDSLKSYDDLSRTTERLFSSDAIEALADELESKILQGKISTSKSGEIYYGNNKFQLKIQVAGSIIKSLTSLLLYLRYEALPGHLLIFDEPEINLHPDNQRRVARILAKLSKLGVKVIVSTHSDYFIRELNNLIMLNKEHAETKALREKYGYEESEILDHKNIGVYLFKDNVATALEVTETGMEAATIDEEINKLNNTSNDIYWTIFEN